MSKNNNLIESFYNWYRGAIRHPKWRWLVILGTVAYLVSPFDISPDIFPIIGWLDDGLLATLLVTELSSLAMAYFNKTAEPGAETDKTGTTTTEDASVIDVEAH